MPILALCIMLSVGANTDSMSVGAQAPLAQQAEDPELAEALLALRATFGGETLRISDAAFKRLDAECARLENKDASALARHAFDKYTRAYGEAEAKFIAALRETVSKDELALTREMQQRLTDTLYFTPEHRTKALQEIEQERIARTQALGLEVKRATAEYAFKAAKLRALQQFLDDVRGMPESDAAVRTSFVLAVTEAMSPTTAEVRGAFPEMFAYADVFDMAMRWDDVLRACLRGSSVEAVEGHRWLWGGDGSLGGAIWRAYEKLADVTPQVLAFEIRIFDRLSEDVTLQQLAGVQRAVAADLEVSRQMWQQATNEGMEIIHEAIDARCGEAARVAMRATVVRVIAPGFARPQWLEQEGARVAQELAAQDDGLRTAVGEIVSAYRTARTDTLASSGPSIQHLHRRWIKGLQEGRMDPLEGKAAIVEKLWRPHEAAMERLNAAFEAAGRSGWKAAVAASKAKELAQDTSAFGPGSAGY